MARVFEKLKGTTDEEVIYPAPLRGNKLATLVVSIVGGFTSSIIHIYCSNPASRVFCFPREVPM